MINLNPFELFFVELTNFTTILVTRTPGVALRIFGICAAAQLVWLAWRMWLENDSVTAHASRFLRTYAILAATGVLLTSWRALAPGFADFWYGLSSHLTGIRGGDPGVLIDQGIGLFTTMWDPRIYLLPAIFNPASIAFALVVSFAILIAYTVIALQVIMILVESHLLLGLGPIFAAFAGNAITARLADNLIVLGARIGIKALVLSSFLYITGRLARHWHLWIEQHPFLMSDWIRVAAAALMVAYIAARLPGAVANGITERWEPGIANALKTT